MAQVRAAELLTLPHLRSACQELALPTIVSLILRPKCVPLSLTVYSPVLAVGLDIYMPDWNTALLITSR